MFPIQTKQFAFFIFTKGMLGVAHQKRQASASQLRLTHKRNGSLTHLRWGCEAALSSGWVRYLQRASQPQRKHIPLVKAQLQKEGGSWWSSDSTTKRGITSVQQHQAVWPLPMIRRCRFRKKTGRNTQGTYVCTWSYNIFSTNVRHFSDRDTSSTNYACTLSTVLFIDSTFYRQDTLSTRHFFDSTLYRQDILSTVLFIYRYISTMP